MLGFFSRNKGAQDQGIWKYADFYLGKIDKKNRLFLSDGNTELIEVDEINKEFGIEHLFFKREDKNETGSLKGRSLAYQVSLAGENKEKNLLISTSGNAGVALSAYAKKADIVPFIFISPETEKEKISAMQKYDPIIISSKRSIRFANYASAKHKIKNLRPSSDNDSIEGFKSIAFEISDKVEDVDAIFTFVTSGSSFVGMYQGFKKYFDLGKIKKIPQMYAVQSGEIFSVSQKDIEDTSQSKAGKLGVKNTRRKKEILEIIKNTNGLGVYVEDYEIDFAREILLKNNLETSFEGCASFASFIKTKKQNDFNKAVCIFSGKVRDENKINENKIYKAESFEDVDKIINKFKR